MTPRELLQRPVERVEHDFQILVGCYYNFVPELGDVLYDFVSTETVRLEIRVFKHFDFDYRRYWRLAAVCFDDEVVMITQNAGREGDDHACRYVLDQEIYPKMVAHLASLRRRPSVEMTEDKKTVIAEMDTDYGEKLTSFYGDHLEGPFQRARY